VVPLPGAFSHYHLGSHDADALSAGAIVSTSKIQNSKVSQPTGSLAVSLLPSVAFGGPGWSVGARAEVIDFIQLSKPPLAASAPEMAELYTEGHSLAVIAKKLGKAKSVVKGTLEAHGVDLRPATGSKEYRRLGRNQRRSSHPPFGFVLLRNQFVPHPKELEIVREMVALSKRGLGPRQISDRLNELGLPTRAQKLWGDGAQIM
jgi:hypothetical protein